MMKTKRILSLLFLALASAALFVACGDETSCLEDGDCAGTEICVAEICETACTTAADCAEGEICTGGDRPYCAPGTDNNNTNNKNNTNNNTTSTNNVTFPAVFTALIRDTTMGAGCDVDDPGSDISAIALETLGGEILGYAEALDVQLGEGETNNYPDALIILDGTAPTFGVACPEGFNADNVAALGCGGYVAVRFLDDGGIPVALDDSMQIRVVEYGVQCDGSADDTYSVFLCSDSAAVLNDADVSSCTQSLLANASGLGLAPVTLP